MMALLEFIFSSFWTFLGTWILIEVTCGGIMEIIKAFKE